MFLFATDSLLDQYLSPEMLRNLVVAVGFLLVGVLLVLTTLFILMRTQWGQSRPLSKCVVLSIFAHVLLMSYAYIAPQFIADRPVGKTKSYEVTRVTLLATDDLKTEQDETRTPHPSELPAWERPPSEAAVLPQDLALTRQTIEAETAPQRTLTAQEASLAVSMPEEVATATDIRVEGDQPQIVKSLHTQSTGATAAEMELPKAERRQPTTPAGPTIDALGRASPDFGDRAPPQRTDVHQIPNELTNSLPDVQRLADVPLRSDSADALAAAHDLTRAALEQTLPESAVASRTAAPGQPLPDPLAARPTSGGAGETGNPTPSGADGDQLRASAGDAAAQRSERSGEPRAAAPRRLANGRDLPSIYELRAEVDRGEIAQQQGGNARTEAAVEAALAWLAANQEADGHWDADKHGAGRETRVFGHDRGGAGAKADTGVTALAVLAFMGAGHTHYEGEYRQNVQRALEFLLRSQGRDGSMAGGAETFAQMYCHGMATLAISEAYALTGDDRLKWWVQRAISYTLAAQHSTEGGWRYRPNEKGDTSQFGWHVMSLKAAENAGIELPDGTWQRAARFLSRASVGRHGGLATYRPRADVSTEEATPAMTAEALACRYFLGLAGDNPATDEAANYLDANRPGRGKMNLYHWYYGTLAMHQVHDERWNRWNEALQTQILPSQRKDGAMAGTWDPDATMWGSYGGRVYTTAMGALCLESYYRFSLARE